MIDFLLQDLCGVGVVMVVTTCGWAPCAGMVK